MMIENGFFDAIKLRIGTFVDQNAIKCIQHALNKNRLRDCKEMLQLVTLGNNANVGLARFGRTIQCHCRCGNSAYFEYLDSKGVALDSFVWVQLAHSSHRHSNNSLRVPLQRVTKNWPKLD